MIEHKILDLAGRIYLAAHEPERWVTIMEDLAAIVGARAGALAFVDPGRDLGFASVIGLPEDSPERYSNHYVQVDPLTPTLLFAKEYDILHCEDVMPLSAFARNEYYEDMLEPSGVMDIASSPFRLEDSKVGVLTFMRAKSSGQFDRGQLSQIAPLLPHVDQATRMFEQFAALHDLERATQAGFDAAHEAMVLSDAAGRVVRANPAAYLLLDRCTGLGIRAGRLEVMSPGDGAILECALRIAAEVGSGRSAEEVPIVRIEEPSGDVLRVRALPVSGGSWLGGVWLWQPTVLLDLSWEKQHRRLAPSVSAELSPRQIEVTELAIAGATIEDMARILGVSENTVRSHLKAIYRKLDVSSRVELLEAATTEAG